jgi:repressor LexA
MTTSPEPLTPKQRNCLDAIAAHAARTRSMPTLEELRQALGSGSRAAVLNLLKQLEARGAIERLPRRARAIRLVSPPVCPRCGETLGATDAGVESHA